MSDDGGPIDVSMRVDALDVIEVTVNFAARSRAPASVRASIALISRGEIIGSTGPMGIPISGEVQKAATALYEEIAKTYYETWRKLPKPTKKEQEGVTP